jgi:uncharacterized membrane protein YfcA
LPDLRRKVCLSQPISLDDGEATRRQVSHRRRHRDRLVGGGILTNILMTLAGMPMHKSIGRAAAAGVVVSFPATIVAAFATGSASPTQLGSIDLAVWASVAPAQAVTAWFGAHLAQSLPADNLSRIMAVALLATGVVMLHSSVVGR